MHWKWEFHFTTSQSSESRRNDSVLNEYMNQMLSGSQPVTTKTMRNKLRYLECSRSYDTEKLRITLDSSAVIAQVTSTILA